MLWLVREERKEEWIRAVLAWSGVVVGEEAVGMSPVGGKTVPGSNEMVIIAVSIYGSWFKE